MTNTPDTPVASAPAKPFRKRRCVTCKEIFYSQTVRKECQNCAGDFDNTAQMEREAKIKDTVNSAITTEAPQTSIVPTAPVKTKTGSGKQSQQSDGHGTVQGKANA